MIVVAAAAFAQDAADCGDGGFPPIAGTSGLANARAALTTNQQTYSAAAFAERQMFQKVAEGDVEELAEGGGILAFEMNTTFGAAQVPVFVDDAVHSPADCPADLRVALSPLDLQAMNLGFGFRAGRFGAFYSASVTYGMIAHPSNYVRALVWGMGVPAYTMPLLGLAPLTGSWMQTQGASAFAMDWIGGAYVTDPRVGQLSLGYAGASKGFYLQGIEDRLGVHASTVLRPGTRPVDVLKGGLDRLDPGSFADALKPIGLLSAFYRDLPFGQRLPDDVAEEASAGAGPALADRFRSGHVQQENVGGVVDVRFAYAVSPAPLVNELAVGLHTPDFTLPRNAVLEDLAYTGPGGRVVAGFVELPDQPSIGAVGGRLFSGRLDFAYRIPDGNGGVLLVSGKLLFNDAEQLVLYPFARNVLSYTLSFGGVF